MNNDRKFSELSHLEKKDAYRYIVLNWDKKSSAQIAQDLRLKYDSINGVATFLRRNGIALAKKSQKFFMEENLKQELISLYKQA